MYNQLTISHGAGGGAPLRAHTVHRWLPRGGHCRRLSHLIWRVGLNFRGDPLLSHSALRWLTDRGGKWLSVIGGLGLMLRTTGRWWAGLWVRSGSGEIIHGADGEWRSWEQLTIRHEGETGSQNTFGAKTQQNSPGVQHYSPLPEGASSHRGTTERGGNGWEPRWRLRRRTNTREGTGWQRPGRWRRREEPGKRQEGPGAGGVQLDPGHSHDDGPRWSRWKEEPWRSDGHRLQGAEQVVEEPEAETESQRARGMLRIRGARVEPRALATEAEIRRSAAEQERLRTQVELVGGRSPTEPVGRNDEAQPEERSPEAMAGWRPTEAEPEGRGSPVELVDWRVMVEVRELGAEVEPLGLQAEAESGPRRLEAEVRDTPAPATLEDGRPAGLAPYR